MNQTTSPVRFQTNFGNNASVLMQRDVNNRRGPLLPRSRQCVKQSLSLFQIWERISDELYAELAAAADAQSESEPAAREPTE